jgi:hypothetical protein
LSTLIAYGFQAHHLFLFHIYRVFSRARTYEESVMIRIRNERKATYDSRTTRNVNLNEVLPVVPCKWCREEAGGLINVAMATKVLAVRAKDNPIGSLLLYTNTIVCKALRGMEVEHPKKPGSLKCYHLVHLVLEADVCLRGVQPAILLLSPLHLAVKLIEEPVAEKVIVDKVELSTSVVEAVVVSLSGKVQPFRMPEFITFEVEIALTSQPVGDQAQHLMQREASINHWSSLSEH